MLILKQTERSFKMELCEKLVELRKKKGLTQEELAKELYVSRTAISKWESGRGVPNIESLKAISKFFCVSIDELLSTDELLTIAQEDSKKRETRIRDLVFALLDLSMILFMFLPLFGQRGAQVVYEISLVSLDVSLYIKILYFGVVFAMVIFGVLTLALQNCESEIFVKYKHRISILLSIIAVVLFTITLQPYASLFAFVFLAIKASMLKKWR